MNRAFGLYRPAFAVTVSAVTVSAITVSAVTVSAVTVSAVTVSAVALATILAGRRLSWDWHQHRTTCRMIAPWPI